MSEWCQPQWLTWQSLHSTTISIWSEAEVGVRWRMLSCGMIRRVPLGRHWPACRRRGFKFGACVVDNEIYVIGGKVYAHTGHIVGRDALTSVDIYSIANNQWRRGPDLPTAIYNVGAFQINGVLYACGMVEHHRTTFRIYRCNAIFKLDQAQATWHQIEADLCNVRDYACIAAKMHTRRLPQIFRPEVDTWGTRDRKWWIALSDGIKLTLLIVRLPCIGDSWFWNSWNIRLRLPYTVCLFWTGWRFRCHTIPSVFSLKLSYQFGICFIILCEFLVLNTGYENLYS